MEKKLEDVGVVTFQSPRGDFGFLKATLRFVRAVSEDSLSFNPLAGILVF